MEKGELSFNFTSLKCGKGSFNEIIKTWQALRKGSFGRIFADRRPSEPIAEFSSYLNLGPLINLFLAHIQVISHTFTLHHIVDSVCRGSPQGDRAKRRKCFLRKYI